MITLFETKKPVSVKPVLKLKSTVLPPFDLFTPTNVHEWKYYIKQEANKINLEVSI